MGPAPICRLRALTDVRIGKGDNVNMQKKKKHLWIIPAYGVFYMTSFVLLERSSARPHVIHLALDDYIPFCEYFIIPYVLWYVFLAVTLCYFAFVYPGRREYYQLLGALGTGMTAFLIISFVYPNGHELRPVLTGDSGFLLAVKILYQIDTPTNVLPSIHVFNTLACSFAVFRNAECRKHRGLLAGTGLLAVLIILSTMFLKQHSVIDVVFAMALYWLCSQIFYKWLPSNWEELSGLLTRKEILTIPNLLSMFRLVLAVLFLGIAGRGGLEANRTVLTGLLILSGLSDFLDGKIARRFHMVSEVGKLLDPIADKVTQGVLLLCLFPEYELAKAVFLLFAVKESYMAVAGTKTIRKLQKNEGAKWYGKVSTAVFYLDMAALIIFREIPETAANILIGCCGGCMLFAFVMYARQYHASREGGGEGRTGILDVFYRELKDSTMEKEIQQ